MSVSRIQAWALIVEFTVSSDGPSETRGSKVIGVFTEKDHMELMRSFHEKDSLDSRRYRIEETVLFLPEPTPKEEEV